MSVSQDFEDADEDVVQALQAAMIASQAGSDAKSVSKIRAASLSIDRESTLQSTPFSRAAVHYASLQCWPLR